MCSESSSEEADALSSVSTFSDSLSSSEDTCSSVEVRGTVLFAHFKTHIRNWNADFQYLLETEDSIEKFEKLAQFGRDFLNVAETYGRYFIVLLRFIRQDHHF